MNEVWNIGSDAKITSEKAGETELDRFFDDVQKMGEGEVIAQIKELTHKLNRLALRASVMGIETTYSVNGYSRGVYSSTVKLDEITVHLKRVL